MGQERTWEKKEKKSSYVAFSSENSVLKTCIIQNLNTPFINYNVYTNM